MVAAGRLGTCLRGPHDWPPDGRSFTATHLDLAVATQEEPRAFRGWRSRRSSSTLSAKSSGIRNGGGGEPGAGDSARRAGTNTSSCSPRRVKPCPRLRRAARRGPWTAEPGSPRSPGFATTSIEDRRALRDNVRAFTGRLREVGFYRDLSDAYVTQTITPRYRIDAEGTAAGGRP